jgi:hypothetical protein
VKQYDYYADASYFGAKGVMTPLYHVIIDRTIAAQVNFTSWNQSGSKISHANTAKATNQSSMEAVGIWCQTLLTNTRTNQ